MDNTVAAHLNVRRQLTFLSVVVLSLSFVIGCDSGDESSGVTDAAMSMVDGGALDASGRSDVAQPMDATITDGSIVTEMGLGDPDTNFDAANASDVGADQGLVVTDGGPVLPDAGMADAELVNCVTPISQLEFVTWPVTFANNCTGCHLPGGQAQAAGVEFVLHDPDNPDRESRADAFAHNLERIIAASRDDMGTPYILRRATGVIPHTGGMALTVGTPAHDSLVRLLEIIERGDDPDCTESPDDVPGYRDIFDRIEQRTPQETWRAFTIQTLGRLPTLDEVRRIRSGRGDVMVGVGNRPGNNMRPGADDGRVIDASASTQLRTVLVMMGEAIRSPEAKAWIKDMWNDVFLFRGIHVQELGRPYEVFNEWDYGARHWSDLCDIEVFETDEDGESIVGPGRQRMCELNYDRFGFIEVLQPNAGGNTVYGSMPVLDPVDACDFCKFTRNGIAEMMLYGAIEAPLELIADTVQSGRPFTEIITTEDIMMNYYTSLVYFGTADPMQNDFTEDMDDVPMIEDLRNGPNWVIFDVRVPDHRAFKRLNRMRRTRQIRTPSSYPKVDDAGVPIVTDAGVALMEQGEEREIVYRHENNPVQPEVFPRAGILTSPAFMTRFPSNDFNLHRHRAWQVLRLFLDYDILDNQGERISLADVDEPNGGATTDPDGDCVGCHVRLDPVAGLFKDFSFGGASKLAATADSQWPENIHVPGWPSIDGGDAIHHARDLHGPPIQLLAQRIAESPRFPRAMVKYAWTQVMGAPPLSIAVDPGSDDFAARSTLLMTQDRFFESLVNGFVSRNYDMGYVYQRLFTSVWYRAKGLRPVMDGEVSDAVYEGVGRHGTVTPEEYFRRIEAIYGEPWPLNAIPLYESWAVTEEEQLKRDFFTRTDTDFENFDQLIGMIDPSFSAFFGGIDFQNSLSRAKQFNSVMSLMARRVANEFACLVVYDDLQKPPASRRFFSGIPVREGRGAVADEESVRETITHLFNMILGLTVEPEGPEVDIAWQLWSGARGSVLDEIEADPVEGARIIDHCRAHGSEGRGRQLAASDPDGQVRAWMAVMSYLMLQPELLQR